MNVMKSIVVGLVCLAAVVAQAGENLVVNGDFEAAGFTGGYQENCGSNWLKGWTCSQAGICTPQGTYLDTAIQAYNNTAWAFLKKASWFSQDIAVPAPGRYRLEFDYCGRKGNINGARTFVTLGDVDIATIDNDGGSSNGTKVVHMAYEFFVPAAGSQTLKFEQKVTSDVSPAFDNIRLELVYVFANLLKVTGEPLGTIPSTPSYGISSNQAASVVCSLSAEATDVGPESRTNSVFTGWTLYTLDPYNSLARASEDGSGATQPVTVNLNGSAKELVWHFASSYKVTGRSATVGAGTVTVSGDWFDDGAECTVTATENEGYVFTHWTGAPDGVDVRAKTITFTVGDSYELVANYANCYYVAPMGDVSGDDGNEGQSAAAPLATVAAAVAKAVQTAGSGVILLPGTHEVTSTIVLDAPVTVKGATGDWKDVILDGLGANRRCFEVKDAGAVVRDLTITNFKKTKAESAAGGAGAYLTAGKLVNCRVTNCKSGRQTLGCAVYNGSATVEDCVIDGNTCDGNMYSGSGYYQTGAAAVGVGLVITNNTGPGGHPNQCVVGAYLAGGVLRDSLVGWNVQPKLTEANGNDADAMTMGVCVAGGTMSGCRVIGNRATYTPPVHRLYGAVRRAGGTITDCVISNNVDAFGHPCDVVGSAGTMTGCTLTDETPPERPLVAYVNPASANPVYPYDTPGTAATNILDALNPQVDGLTVHLAAGAVHPANGVIAIRRNVTLIGDGDRETTVVKGDGKGYVLYFYPTATNALVAGVTIRDGLCDSPNANLFGDVCYTLGGGGNIRFDKAGTVSNCVITAAKMNGRCVAGLGAYMDGGLITHSVLHSFTFSNDATFGLAVRLRGGAMLSHSVVSNAYVMANATKLHENQPDTAAVRVDDGEVRNCLIVDNHLKFAKLTETKSYAAGVYVGNKDGRLVSSTVVGNSVDLTGATVAGGVRMAAAGTVQNCILWNNRNGNSERNAVGTGTGTWNNNVAAEYLSLSGSGNLAAPAVMFQEGTWQLPAGSPVAGLGLFEGWMADATDLAGAPRTRDGTVVDPGAFAYQPPDLGVSVSATDDVLLAKDELLTVLTADVEGDADGLTYRWTRGESDAVLGTERTLAVDLTDLGTTRYFVRVTNAAGLEADGFIDLKVYPSKVYVRQVNPGAMPPFASYATAATNLHEAVVAAENGSEVIVDDGSYRLDSTLRVVNSIPIRSVNGPERTTIWSSTKFRVIEYAASGCTFSGFTVTNGWVSKAQYDVNGVGGGNIFVSNGAIVDNCVIAYGSGERQAGGLGVGVYNAKLRNSRIFGHSVKGGVVESAGMSQIIDGVGLCVAGADSVVSNCQITGNALYGAHKNFNASAGVALKAGKVTHCLIAGNVLTDGWEGSQRLMGAGVFQSGGSLVNCTVASNSCGKAGWGGIRQTGGTAKNCIVWGNTADGDIVNASLKACTYTCTTPLASGEGNLDADPKFRRTRRHEWHIPCRSPCAKAGENGYFMGWSEPVPDGIIVIVR